jgi:hypothetical protein
MEPPPKLQILQPLHQSHGAWSSIERPGGWFAALTKPAIAAAPQTQSVTASFGLPAKFNSVSGPATSAVISRTRAGDGGVFVTKS